MNYVESFTLSSVAAAYASKIFRLNSIYDPNYSDAGHQPYLYDQWAAIFGGYSVYAVSLDLSVQNTTASGAAVQVGVIAMTDNSTTAYSTQALQEVPGAYSTLVGPVADKATKSYHGYYDLVKVRDAEFS